MLQHLCKVENQLRDGLSRQLQARYPAFAAGLAANDSLQAFIDRCISNVRPMIVLQLNDGAACAQIVACLLELLLQMFGPSRIDYVHMILLARFHRHHERLSLHGELQQLLEQVAAGCAPFFEQYRFDLPTGPFGLLDHHIIRAIAERLPSAMTLTAPHPFSHD